MQFWYKASHILPIQGIRVLITINNLKSEPYIDMAYLADYKNYKVWVTNTGYILEEEFISHWHDLPPIPNTYTTR